MHDKTSKEIYDLKFPDAKKTCECGAALKFIDQDRGYQQSCGSCSRKAKYAAVKHTAWNKGLSKDTDKRMKRGAANMRKHYKLHGHHNTGKTKENDKTTRNKSFKISAAVKKFYMTHTHWSLGLTNENSDIIAKRSVKVGNGNRGKTLTEEHKRMLSTLHTLSSDEVKQRLFNVGFTLDDVYVHSEIPIKMRCVKCGAQCVKSTQAAYRGSRCPVCHPPWSDRTSQWQQDIADYVATVTTDRVVLNDRTTLGGLELDIYVPNKRFAIECNGLYWHSEAAQRFAPDAAERKRLRAAAVGIKLLTLFEDEWRCKRHVIESLIRERLNGTPDTTIDCCHVNPSDVKRVTQFMTQHYLGDVPSTIDYSLAMMNDNEIIGVCGLRQLNSTTMEIVGLCHNVPVNGDACIKILVSNAIERASTLGMKLLILRRDCRYDDFDYSTCGMKSQGLTRPQFWMTNYVCRSQLVGSIIGKSRNKIYGCANERWACNL